MYLIKFPVILGKLSSFYNLERQQAILIFPIASHMWYDSLILHLSSFKGVFVAAWGPSRLS